MDHTPRLRVADLSKAYAGPVLQDLALELYPGEVLALTGENGAGKSTLCRILAGLERSDAGTLELDGQPYAPGSRRGGEARGIRLVLQELNTIPTLSVAENIFFTRLPTRGAGIIHRRRLHEEAARIMRDFGLHDIDPGTPAGALGVGARQLVEIAATVSQPCDVLILDEPTAALSGTETELLLGQIRRLRERGTAVIYISHRLEEIQRLADRIAVLRDGRLVGTFATGEVSLDHVIRLMVGRELAESIRTRPTATATPADPALRVEHLCAGPRVRDVSFELRRGEILGLAGLMGSGRTETVRAIFGADRPESGTITLPSRGMTTPLRGPHDAVRHGLAFLTEDRKHQGLFTPLALRANVTVTDLAKVTAAGGRIDAAREQAVAQGFRTQLAIRSAGVEQPAQNLSGGNQQKVVLAKWLHHGFDVFLLDEPTRGIDVGAKVEIYRLLDELTAARKAVLVVSSDLKELMTLCDRIAVMSAGRLVATFARGEWTQDAIMAAAFSGHRGGAGHLETPPATVATA